MADEEGRLSNLFGYEEVTKDLETYSKPIFVVGPEGTGKRSWAESHVFQDKLCVRTDASKAELEEVENLLTANSSFVWVLCVDRAHNWDFILHLFQAASQAVIILAYTDLPLPYRFESVASVHYSPYLSEEQLLIVGKEQGLKDDAAEFAARAAQGIPGNVMKSFEKLRSRALILEALEHIRDDNYSALVKLIPKVTHIDIELFDSILVSFRTNSWIFFTEEELEPFRKIVNLMEECLWNNSRSNKSLKAKTILVGALHAYHGRV